MAGVCAVVGWLHVNTCYDWLQVQRGILRVPALRAMPVPRERYPGSGL